MSDQTREQKVVPSTSEYYDDFTVDPGEGLGNEVYGGWPAQGNMPRYPELELTYARTAQAARNIGETLGNNGAI